MLYTINGFCVANFSVASDAKKAQFKLGKRTLNGKIIPAGENAIFCCLFLL